MLFVVVEVLLSLLLLLLLEPDRAIDDPLERGRKVSIGTIDCDGAAASNCNSVTPVLLLLLLVRVRELLKTGGADEL